MKKIVFISLLFLSLVLKAQDVKSYKGPDSLGVYTLVQQPPEYIGGYVAMIKFIQKKIVYPKNARENNVQGKVLLRFVINEDGKVGDIKVITSVNFELGSEAVRVVSILRKFKPGTQQGKPVKVYFTLPIGFAIAR